MQRRYAIIGAGPSGLAAARAFQKKNIEFVGFESSNEVGGLWNIDNPRSTMYESAHLISSRTTTEFAEYPMDSATDYPSHRELRRYFSDFADHFDLRRHFRFDTPVESVVRAGDGAGASEVGIGLGPEAGASDGDTGWLVNGEHFTGVVLANGTLAKPTVPTFRGEFAGEIRHSSEYRSASEFDGKRVLIIGAGNSGCDIAVDAVHHAASTDLSVRRGYYFVPRYIFGRPSDTLNQGRPLPAPIKQFIDSRVLRAFTGDPVHFGFPKPDYKIYESHPIVNTAVLGHLGQGDLTMRPDIDRFDGHSVHFSDGTSGEYDLVLLATGYTLDYPFVEREAINWTGAAPELFLNVFPPSFNGLFVLGMVEASGIGWQGRAEQADLVASYLTAEPRAAEAFRARAAKKWPDLTGGYNYLAYRRTVKAAIARLEKK